MSKGLVHTHAGDDSDGKIWGIGGMNLLLKLAGLLISIGLALLLSRHQAPTFSVGAGAVPFALVMVYVFAFRQGKPKAFDTDWLETQATRLKSERKGNAATQRLICGTTGARETDNAPPWVTE